jgi:hypothetical protein
MAKRWDLDGLSKICVRDLQNALFAALIRGGNGTIPIPIL